MTYHSGYVTKGSGGQSPALSVVLCLLRRQPAMQVGRSVVKQLSPGRRPLRIHELRKFTGYANVTGEYRRDIRLIILAIFSEFIDSQRTDE